MIIEVVEKKKIEIKAIRFDGTKESVNEFRPILKKMGETDIKFDSKNKLMESVDSDGDVNEVTEGEWLIFWTDGYKGLNAEWLGTDEEFHSMYELI